MRFGSLLGSMLGAFGGRALGQAVGGNAGGLLGSLAGSMLGGRSSGGLGGLLKNLGIGGGGGQQQQATQQRQQQQTEHRGTDLPTVTDHQGQHQTVSEEHAAVLVKAMCFAAKSDGNVDEKEIAAILGRLGEVDNDEKEFVKRELSGPVNLEELLAAVPRGIEEDVYAASLLAIDSVSGAEAEYLQKLARGLGLTDAETSQIKAGVGL
jgi:uncharacterized membrane protein YebE (DUF533 family)